MSLPSPGDIATSPDKPRYPRKPACTRNSATAASYCKHRTVWLEKNTQQNKILLRVLGIIMEHD